MAFDYMHPPEDFEYLGEWCKAWRDPATGDWTISQLLDGLETEQIILSGEEVRELARLAAAKQAEAEAQKKAEEEAKKQQEAQKKADQAKKDAGAKKQKAEQAKKQAAGVTNNGLASTGSDTTAIATLAAIMTIAGAGCVLVRVRSAKHADGWHAVED